MKIDDRYNFYLGCRIDEDYSSAEDEGDFIMDQIEAILWGWA